MSMIDMILVAEGAAVPIALVVVHGRRRREAKEVDRISRELLAIRSRR